MDINVSHNFLGGGLLYTKQVERTGGGDLFGYLKKHIMKKNHRK